MASYRGYVLIPTVNGLFREQFIECDKPTWNTAVMRSGHAAADYLRENIAKKVRAVLTTDPDTGKVRVVVSQIGHHAREHVRQWYATLRHPLSTPQDIRAQEKVLRHSVRYWMTIFPESQRVLCEELYVQYLRSLTPFFDGPPAKICVACSDYENDEATSYELCDACRESPMFQERARKHLASFFLPWNQGGHHY